jgi:hypothetical protein
MTLVSFRRLAVAVLCLCLAECGGANPPGRGYEHSIVFFADGVFDLNEPSSDPRFPPVPGFPTFVDSTWWQKELMKQSDARIAAERAEAVAFFRERFGVDVEDPALAGRIAFRHLMVDPRTGYRVHTMSGHTVPPEGYEVLDGSWITFVTDPNGLVLGGRFAGLKVPPGGMIALGTYYIAAPEPFAIRLKSDSPIMPNGVGLTPFVCHLEHPVHGPGIAEGVSMPVPRQDGLYQANIRNVLTFPAYGPSSR